jgi:tetratricopeptide (TPR) repeat protein
MLFGGMNLSKVETLWFNGDTKALKSMFSKSDDEVSVYNLAYLEMLDGNSREARIALGKLEKINKDWFEYLFGEYLYRQRDYENALAHLSTAYDNDPDDLKNLLRIGKSYIALGEYEKARIFLLKRLDDFDNDAITSLVAESYMAEDKLDMALKWLLRSKDIFPGMKTLWNLVLVYHRVGNKKKVLEYGVILSSNFGDGVYYKQLERIFKKDKLPLSALKPDRDELTPLLLNSGEKLVYDVSYGFFSLGTLTIEITDTVNYRGHSCYVVEYFIDSAEGIPFIDLHHKYQTYLDKKKMTAWKSIGITDNSDGINRRAAVLDSREHLMKTYMMFTDGRLCYNESPLPDETVDAMSLLFYARQMVKNKVSGTVTTVIQGEYKTADIFYRKEKETIEIIDKDYNAETVYAKANFTGLAGMTGDVWGWFIGETRVPAIGKAQIFLGKVTLELVQWKP